MVPANVALKWVLEPVVAHVDGVHDGIHEGKVAVLAHVGTSQFRGGGAAKKCKMFSVITGYAMAKEYTTFQLW